MLPILGEKEIREDDLYGYARVPEHLDRIEYGRFRNVYLYITEKCQLRCAHCYMGERLESAKFMPLSEVKHNIQLWRKMGGSKLSILGGEPTLHPDFIEICRYAKRVGYEKIILNTNGLRKSLQPLSQMDPEEFSYIQVSLDGGSSETHDLIRGPGTFNIAWKATQELAARKFDTRIICTVNRKNREDCLDLISKCEAIGVSLVKFHVFSSIGNGQKNAEWAISPTEWIEFYEHLERMKKGHKIQIWYQPTYANRSNISRFTEQGYRGCIGRTLDRISIFPDGRAYVCSYLFDTTQNMFFMENGEIKLNRDQNEYELFTKALTHSACGSCKSSKTCLGGCPAEKLVMGQASCASDPDIIPVCRLWKSDY
ncbi:MAG: radical SAM protein [Candidatus Rhabdochlamydia sp.]